MSAIGSFKNKKLTCIPNNMEKYISFSMGNLRFIDSLQFLNASLEKLVSNLAADGMSKFKHLKTEFKSHHELLIRKGVYPYDYVDSPQKLCETVLPPREAFFSQLSQLDITEQDYQHANQIWQVFQCNTLGDYHELYIKTDVLLLADVFENFRILCLQTYKLDPVHYFASPGLSWDAMLRHTKVNLQLIEDADMYLMIESGLRGGISMISNKYAKANNPYFKDYNAEEPTSYIVYLDANNLYGWAMFPYLPEKKFDWMTPKQIASFDPLAVPDTSPTGYILEVDLEYPDEIHDSHSDYPLAPERLTIDDAMLSPYSQALKQNLGIKGPSCEKLVPNLLSKSKYVVHYRNLKLYLQLGMKLTKIHRGIEFTQSSWLTSYISLNTELRKKASNAFEKEFLQAYEQFHFWQNDGEFEEKNSCRTSSY